MALLDVSELLVDPDFCDPFVVTRSRETVDDNGRSVLSSFPIQGYGSVQPASDRTYGMFPDMTRVDGDMEVFTICPLIVANSTFQADTMTWEGRNYVVRGVADFGNFGQGYYVALITLTSLLGPELNRMGAA